ncbi:MAG: signal recognition particle receptor subunit alpha, partial [Candidatus Latescibacterota bacterium]
MFSGLSEKLDTIFSKLKSRGKLSEKDISEMMQQVKRALLEADVNYRIVKEFVTKVEEKARDESVIKSFTPAQQIVRIVNEELTVLLGGTAEPFHITGNFASVMLAGLQGSGKTTFCAKLGSFLKKKGRKPLLVALDIYRPAAMEQLAILGRQIDIPVSIGERDEKDVRKLFKQAQERARELMCDTLILDTAGRL